MSIRGTLKSMSVADLLQFLAAGRKTGTLKIGRGTIVKQIFLEDGLIVGSSSNDPKELMGQVLLHYGKIGESDLQVGLEIQRRSGRRLGTILASRGLVTQDDIMEVLRTRTLEIIYDLFIWEEADFEFLDNEPLPDDLIRIQVNATSVTMDGFYRIDEWARYRSVIKSDRTFFELNPAWIQSANDDNETRNVLLHVEKGMTAAEICYNLHTSLFHGSALLFDLVNKGVIRVAGEAPPPAEEPADHPAESLPQTVPELLSRARAELAEGPENALAAIHNALNQEPNNLAAHQLREEAEQKLIAQIYKNGVSPKAVPRLLISFEQLEQQRLDPQEGFVLSRINGELDVASVVSVCPFREADTLRMIKKLLDSAVIEMS
ncbi:MAG TPA: DUF4388 domain-containing protein [Pyrinomonadaceae bacterium]|nr:DUF4388 domain-containing protein [Pyrinomonadaceae bacterium]